MWSSEFGPVCDIAPSRDTPKRATLLQEDLTIQYRSTVGPDVLS